MGKFPVLSGQPETHKDPVLLSTPGDKRWSFSFRYWKQLEYFGLDKSRPKWFVSLLEKLKELSNKEIEKFITDSAEMDTWRYHAVKWTQKNIPIQRDDMDWIDTVYRNNPDDYPILQFQVSRALGRIVGFWDENNVFNIALLDPLHNIQPTKSHDYKVDDCSPLSCEYSSLLSEVHSLKQLRLCKNDCGYPDVLDKIPTSSINKNVLIHFLDDKQKAELDSVITDKSTYTDILMIGVDFFKETQDN